MNINVFENYIYELFGEVKLNPVKAWKNNDKAIKTIGVLTGSGMSTNDVKEAVERNSDVYITGENIS